MKPRAGASGFTLVELIVVIVLSGIVAAFVARNIARPLLGFVDVSRRAELVDTGDTAISRIIRESRLALPNSIRVQGGVALEFLRTRSGGRYRRLDIPGGGENPLDFVAPDTSFDVLGQLNNFGVICAATTANCGASVASTTACMASTAQDCLVIYNTGQPADCSLLAAGRSNAYCGDNVAGIDIADTATATMTFAFDSATENFPLPSPNQRFHVVDTPVTYLCNLGTAQLLRFDGYPIAATQPTIAAPPATVGRVVADKITGCEFVYDPGNSSRAAILSVRLTLADSDALSESITLFQQAHVPNVP